MIGTHKQNIVIETVFKTSTNGERRFHSTLKLFQVNVELKIRRDCGKKIKKCFSHVPVIGSEFEQQHRTSRVGTQPSIYFSEMFLNTNLSDALMTVLWFISLISLTFSFNLA